MNGWHDGRRERGYPRMFWVAQHPGQPWIEDVPGAVHDALAGLELGATIREGETVAIAVGSRGIAELPRIAGAVVDHLKALGAVPFVVPAMGSHGGATAEGQVEILAALGIVPEALGCEIRASMETVHVADTRAGTPIYWSREAARADHVVVCNRVKPHATFQGTVESGLLKMLAVGLGNYRGARAQHRAFDGHGFEPALLDAARTIVARCPVLGGVAVVENGCGQVGLVRALGAEGLEEGEKALLVQAREWLPRLPFATADLLIVDEMGKNLSGTGVDGKVIGPRPGSAAPSPAAKVAGTVERVARVYGQQVLHPAPGARGRRIGHVEFWGTVLRRGPGFLTRTARRAATAAGFRGGTATASPGRAQGSGRELPRMEQVFIRSLTRESCGNVTGLDRADLIRSQVLEEVDWRATLLNALSAGLVALPEVPPAYDSDREALDAFFAGAGEEVARLKVMRIKNTLHLCQVGLSAAYRAEVEGRADLEILTEEQEMRFDAQGNLV